MDSLDFYKAYLESALALRNAISEYLYHDGDRAKLLRALQDAKKVGEEAMR